MSDKPLISVCIPMYNGEKYMLEMLQTLLTNILNFQMNEIEVVVCDDRSTDIGFDVLVRRLEKHKYFKLVILENRKHSGIAATLNKCIMHSTGQWIKPLFQDDELRPNCLTSFVDKINNYSSDTQCGFLVANRDLLFDGSISNYGRQRWNDFIIKHAIEYNFIDFTPILPKQFVDKLLTNDITINFIGEPTSVMIRRDVFDRVGYFNTDMIQLLDWEMWIRIASNYGLYYIPEILSSYRIHQNSASTINKKCNFKQVVEQDPAIMRKSILTHKAYRNYRALEAINGLH